MRERERVIICIVRDRGNVGECNDGGERERREEGESFIIKRVFFSVSVIILIFKGLFGLGVKEVNEGEG